MGRFNNPVKRVLISRPCGNLAEMDALAEEDNIVQDRIRGLRSVNDPSSDVVRVRNELRNYRTIYEVVDGMTTREFEAYSRYYLARAAS